MVLVFEDITGDSGLSIKEFLHGKKLIATKINIEVDPECDGSNIRYTLEFVESDEKVELEDIFGELL